MAKGALAGIEPPDMELRVYQAGTVNSLKSWLTSVGFLNSGSAAQPYRNTNVSGVKLCQSTLIAPGCFVYVLHDGRVYQLTPISREGEAMLETFALSTAVPKRPELILLDAKQNSTFRDSAVFPNRFLNAP